jgi:hypothetical protein
MKCVDDFAGLSMTVRQLTATPRDPLLWRLKTGLDVSEDQEAMPKTDEAEVRCRRTT